MSTAIERLAEIRAMSGKDPLPDPTKIMGDPGVGPLGPPLDPDLPKDWIDPELDAGEDPPYMKNIPPSPLIPSAKIPTPAPEMARMIAEGLVVVGTLGAWRGREVQLLESEEARIREVVLLAIKRELDADLNLVAKRRKRKAQGAAPDGGAPVPHPAPAPKRRGRPRGSLLR